MIIYVNCFHNKNLIKGVVKNGVKSHELSFVNMKAIIAILNDSQKLKQ